jgi:hypothetical protein
VLFLSISAAICKREGRARARSRNHLGALLLTAAFISIALLLPPRAVSQTNTPDNSVQEIVANLDSGRAVIGVAKDGIVVATLENPIEPMTRPPAIVQVSGQRVAVLFGATDWWLPDERRELSQLETDLRSLPLVEGPASPSLQTQAGVGGEATDIEEFGNRLHAQLNWIAGFIHGNLHLSENEPVIEMLLVDYAPDYGPEVWLVEYSFEQDPEQGDFWQTIALPPQYTQLWPPEKGQPHGLVEVSYPAGLADATVEQLLRSGDPRVARAIAASPDLQSASEGILNGDVGKLTAVDVAALLRAALGAIAAPNARMVEAEINQEQGVGWFIPPPPIPALPGAESPRPPGAPSLLHPPGKPGGPGSF